MFAYVARRLLVTVPLLIVATFIVFWLVSTVSDPRNRFAANPAIDTPEERAAVEARLNELYGLDDPIPVRWVNWMVDAGTGDLGTSTSQGENPVSGIFWKAAKNSAYVAVPAFIITALFAIILGVFSAIRQYSVPDYFITGLSFVGLAFPTFFLGLLLQIFWNLWWPDWTGTKPFFVFGLNNDTLLDTIRSCALPVMTLAAVGIAAESRFARASMLEVTNSDYIRTARAKGLSERRVVFRHALRNAMIPVVTLWALDFAALLGGSVITETVFGWPGLGPLFLTALGSQDVDLMMAIVLFTAFLTVTFNLIADVLYGILDPRVRYE